MRVWLGRRVSHFLEGAPLVLASGLTLLCMPAIVAIAWVSTGHWQTTRIESAIQRQTVQIAQQLTDSESDLESAFGRVKSITTWVAEEGHVLQALLRPEAVAETNVFLDQIASSFGLDLIYVMNADGISVTASNADSPASTVGKDYSDREHFQTAITGIPGRQFAVGRTTHIAGFFFSMPIRKEDQVVGTVGIKLDQPRLQYLVRIAGSIVTDDYGIVVLAENPKYMFNVLPDATVHKLSVEQRMRRYARTDFTPLPLVPGGFSNHEDVMMLDGAPVLVGSRTMVDAGLTVHVVSDFGVLSESSQQRQDIFLLGTLAGIGLVWGFWVAMLYFLRARDYRRRLEIANTQLSTLNNELHDQATHDSLTGCLNRRAFNALLSSEMERANRYGGELSVAMLDLDHFKRVNDTRGHAVGDVALQFLVASLTRQLRRTDMLARYGGEEFVLLMPNTSLTVAFQVVDRMRQMVASEAVPGLAPPLSLTFSAGVTGWHPGVSERGLLNAADAALYAAKGSGRNRVMQAET